MVHRGSLRLIRAVLHTSLTSKLSSRSSSPATHHSTRCPESGYTSIMTRHILFDPTNEAAFLELRGRYDWMLLQNSSVHCVDDVQVLATSAEILERLNYLVVRMDAATWPNAAAMHDSFASALSFPNSYGRNLDALNDALGDVAEFSFGSNPEKSGTVLTIANFDAAPDLPAACAALDIFARQARRGLLVGHPMLCVVVTERQLPPVGAMPVYPSTLLTPLSR